MRTAHESGAGAPGQVTPAESEDARGGAGIKGLGERTENPDCAESDAERKRFASLQALAAINGWRLDRIGDRFLISRWRWSAELPDLDAAEQWLRRAGVRT